MADVVDVVIQPIGRTPGVLEPPLAKFRPQVVVLITSREEFSNSVIENIKMNWIKHTARMPEIIVKVLIGPWTSDTVDRYMEIFDEVVAEISTKYEGKTINWHVGTAGGTNLMGIGSALSAFTHRFSVYYSTEKDRNPGKKIEDLCIEIPFFRMLGPGFKALQKARGMKFMKFIASNGPVQNDAIIKFDESTKQNVSAGLKPLRGANLIQKTDLGWVATNVGKSLLALMDYEEE